MYSVLHVCEYAAAYKGNFIHSLLKLEAYLKEKGISQVYLFTSRARKTDAAKWIEELKAQGHTAYVMSDSFAENLKLIKRIKSEHNVKKIFRHFAGNSSDVLTKLSFKGKDTVHFFHGVYMADAGSVQHKIRKILYKDNLLVGVSQTVSQGLEKLFPRNKTVTVENAICFERLDNPEDFETGENISCLALGYNIKLKGTDLALDAMAKINEKRRADLYIVAASHRQELNALIESKFSEKPQWLHILPPVENISTYFKSADVLLAPSRSEGFHYVAVEASYCKIPIVPSNIPQHLSLCIDKRYCFKTEDVEDFVCKLEKAIDEIDSDKSKQVRQEVNQAVQREYNIDIWCKKVYELIGE